MTVTSYLYFRGRAEEAIAFYEEALGAQREALMRFEDMPQPAPGQPAGWGRKVLHASLRVGSTALMLSDGMGEADGGAPAGFALAITAQDADQARAWFDGLADGGQVRMPLGPTFFAAHYGIVADRFGIAWMVMVPRVDAAMPMAIHEAVATIAVRDLPAARRFYEGTLGFVAIGPDVEGVVGYGSGSSSLLLYASQYGGGAGKSSATRATWPVAGDFRATVAALAARGVRFLHYDDLPGTRRDGDVHLGDAGMQTAWFHDSEGNVLCLVQG